MKKSSVTISQVLTSGTGWWEMTFDVKENLGNRTWLIENIIELILQSLVARSGGSMEDSSKRNLLSVRFTETCCI